MSLLPENPEKMLNQLIWEMNEQLSESKKSVAHAIADEKKLERQLIEHKNNSEKWEQNAMTLCFGDPGILRANNDFQISQGCRL